MQNAIVVNGRLVNPTRVELDEPVANMDVDVEVVLRARENGVGATKQSLHDFLQRLPAGTRSREEIDREIRDERDAWEGVA